MSLIISMLPVYILANLHCLGMCGPLVMMLGRHRYRWMYFVGRLVSFTLGGVFAGGVGSVLQMYLLEYQVPAFLSLSFGCLFISVGFYKLLGLSWFKVFSYRLAGVGESLSLLLLKDGGVPVFMFGFFTVFLPCGQSLMVFSLSALLGGVFLGGVNSFVFALLTSVSLFGAMNMHSLLVRFRGYYDLVMLLCIFFVGFVSLCRGFVELELMSHVVFNFQDLFHLVLF